MLRALALVAMMTVILAGCADGGSQDGEETAPPGPEADLTSLLAACPEARTLLRRLTLDWVDGVAGRIA